MIADLLRFALLNLGASLVAGLLVAGAVLGASHVLGIRDARVRSWLLGAALVKSTLVFAGVTGVLLAPAAALDIRALPPWMIGPFVLAWAGLLLLLRGHLVGRLRHGGEAAGGVEAAGAELARLRASVARLTDAARRLQVIETACLSCAVPGDLAVPAVRVGDGGNPHTVDPGGEPIIVIPAALLAQLDDEELDAVVSHELGHVLVARDREACAPIWARVARWTSPSAALIGALLDREEELACDDLAVRLTGRQGPLASALLKAFRQRRSVGSALAPVTNLIGRPQLLRDRIARLAAEDPVVTRSAAPRVAAACALTLLVTIAL
jgi:Zn-dependent protease with chaperone function